jgi:hypothetical protein
VGNYEAALPLPSSAAYVGELELILLGTGGTRGNFTPVGATNHAMGFAVLGNHRSARHQALPCHGDATPVLFLLGFHGRGLNDTGLPEDKGGTVFEGLLPARGQSVGVTGAPRPPALLILVLS